MPEDLTPTAEPCATYHTAGPTAVPLYYLAGDPDYWGINYHVEWPAPTQSNQWEDFILPTAPKEAWILALALTKTWPVRNKSLSVSLVEYAFNFVRKVLRF